ncbi:hypothetical protein GCM10027591_03140 [Zhihengliuella somnathii]
MQVSLSKRGAVAALGVAAVLALSACGGDGTTTEPSSSGATSSAPQTSASPTATEPEWPTPEHPARNLTPPEMPEKAKEFSEEGFEAFIEYWFALETYGIATGDGGPVKEVSAEGCPYCTTALDVIGNISQGQGKEWIVGGTMQPTDIVVRLNGEEQSSQTAYLTLRQLSGDAYNADGLMEGGRNVIEGWVEPFEFQAVFQNGGWKAQRIEVRK